MTPEQEYIYLLGKVRGHVSTALEALEQAHINIPTARKDGEGDTSLKCQVKTAKLIIEVRELWKLVEKLLP